MYTASIIVTLAALGGSVDLSSVMASKVYLTKEVCEKDVLRAMVATRRVYPLIQVRFAGCVPSP